MLEAVHLGLYYLKIIYCLSVIKQIYTRREKISSILKAEQRVLVATIYHHLCLNLWPLSVAKMSTCHSSPFDPERRVRSTLKKVFRFDSFKTPLQERATMAVVKGNIAKLPVFTLLQAIP